MLPRGSISKVYKYYFTTTRFSDEVLQAMREFFDRPDLDRGGFLETDEKSEGLFNEWFLYDFVLTNGKTTLANFVAENPLNFSADEMAFYQSLLETNAYGLYEILSIDINIGLMLKNLQTEVKIYVHEQKLTSQVKPGNIFFGRAGQVKDHYELIGADTFSLGKLGGTDKKFLHEMNLKLTPKIARDLWKENQGS
ncbi:MAG TPA: hypothetical protein VJJ73_02350 [Candidatus Paceibacterota bacterium]